MSVEGQFQPSRVQSNRYRLRIKSRKNDRIDITNTSYIGIGDFKENNETYISFVKELHQKMMTQNPNIIFKSGISPAGYYLSILMAVLLLIVLVAAGYFFFSQGMIAVVFIKAVFIIFYYPSLIRYIQKNKPGFYDPIVLTPDIIPEI
ncbi:hypothetical protein [Emcibacter sp.]|uniref:hypothetical protein n=1 Tax=Emcibacter sp. TaxID=1979954 RepID=UPI002AA820D2|nr:hypothetical protein [Emcibacter sp.]